MHDETTVTSNANIVTVTPTSNVVSVSSIANEVKTSGPMGPAGSTSTLQIGTVTSGTAGATITGNPPLQTLNLTLPTTGNNTVGASQIIDGSITSSKFAANTVVGENDYVMSTNTFGGRKIFNARLENSLYLAHKRFSVSGNFYLKSDDSLVGAISATNLSYLFDGDGEVALQIPQGQYAVVTINPNSGNFPGYPYGYLYVGHYYNYFTESVSVRVYCNYAPHGIGWHSLTFSDYTRGATWLIQRAYQQYYNISSIEFTLRATDVGSNPGYSWVNGIDWVVERTQPSIHDMPYFSKYADEVSYKNLSFKLTSAGNDLVKLSPTAINYFNNGYALGVGTTSPSGTMQINTLSASTTGLIVQGSGSQSATLQEWQNNSATKLASITSDGSLTAASATLTGNLTLSVNSYIRTYPTSTGGYAMGLTMWSADTTSASNIYGRPGFTGRNLSWNGSQFVMASTNSGNNWGVLTGVLYTETGTRILGRAASDSGLDYGLGTNLDSVTRVNVTTTGLVGIGTVTNTTSMLDVTNNISTGIVPLTIRGITSQGVNLTEWKNSAGTTVASMNALGSTFTLSPASVAQVRVAPTTSAAYIIAKSADSAARIYAMGPANYNIGFAWSSSNEALRWQLLTDSVAESGANAGSNLNLYAYDDAGNYLFVPIGITRSSGYVSITRSANIKAAAANGTPLTVDGKTSQSVDLQQWRNVDATPMAKVEADGSISSVRVTSASDVTKIGIGTWGYLQDRNVGGDTTGADNYRTQLLHNAYVTNMATNTYAQKNSYGRKWAFEMGGANAMIRHRVTASGGADTWDDTGWTALYSQSPTLATFSTSLTAAGLKTTAGWTVPIVNKTGAYGIATTDYIINCTANTFAVTLPTAVGITGQQFVVVNSGSGTITLNTTSSQTISGASSKSLAQWATYTVVSDGANWIIV